MTDDILANNGINIEDGLVNAGDNSVGLADFLDIDTSEIDANEGGFENLPQGIYQFTTDDINDMLDGIEDKMADLEAQLTYDNMDEDVPF